MKAKITEVFKSIQGEGLYLGQEQVFARFFGCNLRCKFCDTKLDYFSEYTAEELFSQIKSQADDCRVVSFTGGEPLLQADFLKEILPFTRNAGFTNYLETNGTLPEELRKVISDIDIIAMDFKLASSTGMENFWEAHRRFLQIALKKEVFLKVIVCADTREDDLSAGINLINELDPGVTLVLQPDSNADNFLINGKLNYFKDICGRAGISACAIPQVHKIAGVK